MKLKDILEKVNDSDFVKVEIYQYGIRFEATRSSEYYKDAEEAKELLEQEIKNISVDFSDHLKVTLKEAERDGSLRRLIAENVINIMQIITAMIRKGELPELVVIYDIVGDSRDFNDMVINLAESFERAYADVNWDEDERDYDIEILAYTRENIKKALHLE